MLGDGCGWIYSAVKGAAAWAINRCTDYEKRKAEAEKIRSDAHAITRKADAEAILVLASAREKEAEARKKEIENEKAEELLRRLKEKGIELAASCEDGKVQVAVVKECSFTVPDLSLGEKPTKKRRAPSRKKAKPSGDAPEPNQ
jgi:uncharacterized membrane protein YqiK